MLILPIGHEHTAVRRLPWVTFGVMGLCVVAHLLTLVSPAGVERVANRERVALRYYFEHPYLELDARLKGYHYLAMRQQAPDGARPPTDPERLRGEQEALDRLTAAVFEAVDEMPYFRWGLIPSRVQPYAVVTHMFMHGGWMHLLGNLFILYLVGPFIEDVWGRPLFAAFYVLGGITAGMLFAAMYPRLEEPLIGASGAIAAVMGAFAVRYFATKITFFYFFFFLFRIYHGTFLAPAWLMLGLWFLKEVANAQGWWSVSSLADGGGIAYWAHVAGFGFGLAVAFAVRATRVEERFIHPSIEARRTVFDNSEVERAVELARSGREGEALRRLRARLASTPEDPDALGALWGVARGGNVLAEHATLALPLVRRAAREGDVDLLRPYWLDLMRVVPELRVDLALGVRCAELLRERGELEDAAETVDWLEQRLPPDPSPALLVRLARVAASLHRPSAERYAALARGRPDLSPEAAQELDRLGEGVGETVRSQPEAVRQPAPAARLRVLGARALELGPDALEVEVQGARRRLPLAQVRAVGLASVEGEGRPARLVVDLLLDLPGDGHPPPRTLRLEAGFDPRALVGGLDPREALAGFVGRVVERSGGRVLPGGLAAGSLSLARFESLEEYERALLDGV